jgi:PleD family two-component response regulator
MNLGADDYITKPYRREELLAAISSRLARKASLDEAALRLRTAASQGQQYDALTTLPGKEQFDKRLAAAVEGCSGTSNVVSVVCLGLDGFSKVNDSPQECVVLGAFYVGQSAIMTEPAAGSR